jgi:hypothetical protein
LHGIFRGVYKWKRDCKTGGETCLKASTCTVSQEPGVDRTSGQVGFGRQESQSGLLGSGLPILLACAELLSVRHQAHLQQSNSSFLPVLIWWGFLFSQKILFRMVIR